MLVFIPSQSLVELRTNNIYRIISNAPKNTFGLWQTPCTTAHIDFERVMMKQKGCWIFGLFQIVNDSINEVLITTIIWL
jgi:hypothetical protein